MDNVISINKLDLIRKLRRSTILSAAEKSVLIAKLQHMNGACRGLYLIDYMCTVDFTCCIEAWEKYHARKGLFKDIETKLFGEPQWDQWLWGFNYWRIDVKQTLIKAPTLNSVTEVIHILNLDMVFKFYVYCNGYALELNDLRNKRFKSKKIIGLSNIIDDPKSFGILLER